MRGRSGGPRFTEGAIKVGIRYFSKNSIVHMFFAAVSAAACVGFGWLSVHPQISNTEYFSLVASPSPSELGAVNEGEHKVTFVLENTGKKDIVLSAIERSCDCLDVTVSKRELAPGESAEAVCVWDTRGLRGDSGTSLTVYYAFPGKKFLHRLPVQVKGSITPDIDFSPVEVAFNIDGGIQSHEIVFSPQQGKVKGCTIKNVRSYSSAIRAELTGDLVVNVAFTPNDLRGEQRRFQLDVAFDSVDGHIVRVPVVIHN